MASPLDIKAIDSLWAELQNQNGFRSSPDLTLMLRGPTFQPMTLYVEATGNDGNPGSSDQPLKTIQAALNLIPKIVRHPVNIKVGVGNFGAFAVMGFLVDADSPDVGAWINVEGTLIDATVATGTATGIVTGSTAGTTSSATLATMTDSTQTWTVDNLKGKVVEITAGTGVGQIYPIVSNTIDTITLSTTFWTVPANGVSTYAIRAWGTNINTCLNSNVAIGAAPSATTINAGGCVYANNNVSDDVVTAVQIQKLQLTPPAARALFIGGPFSFQALYCNFSLTGTISAGVISSDSSRVTQCVLQNSGTTGGFLTMRNVKTAVATRNFFWRGSTAISFGPAYGSSNLVQNVFEGCVTGVQITGPMSVFQVSSMRFLNCTTGIDAAYGNSIGGGTIQMASGVTWDFTGCGTAIKVGGVGSQVLTLGTGKFTGTGNTVVLSLVKGGSIQVSAGSTITGTTEISLDGVAATLADMRAASPKLLTNGYGTLVYE